MKLHINEKLLPIKGHYFLFNAGTAPVVPFMPIYARQLGFSSVIVGTIYLVLPFIGLLAKPLFGAIVDRFQRPKFLFILFQLITAIAFLCILFIPSIGSSGNVDFHCNDGVSDLRYCPPNGQQIEQCLIDDLTRERTNETDQMLICKLKCTIPEQWMWDVICQEWQNNSDYCIKDGLQFVLTTEIDMNHIEQNGDCLFFENKISFFNDDRQYPVRCPANIYKRYFKSNCEALCNNDNVMKVISPVESTNGNKDVSKMYQFWLFFLFMGLSWAGMAVVVSVGDAICFGLLGDKFNLYGNQRLWGSVGWGVISIFSGFLVDFFSKGKLQPDYSILFYIMAVLVALDMIVSSKLNYIPMNRSSNILKDISVMFLSLPIMVFFLWCIAVGLCTALTWNFLFWHLEDLADAKNTCGDEQTQTHIKTLEGFVMAIQSFGGELPFFFLSGWILKKIGHINAMSLVLFGFGIRFLLYSVLTNPWFVLPIELFQGITFGIFYSTMASYASLVAPPGTETTLQGLVGAIFEGIGVSIGSFIGGILIENIGGSLTFRMFGMGALTLCLVHFIVQKLIVKSRQKSGKENDIDDIVNINNMIIIERNVNGDDDTDEHCIENGPKVVHKN